MVGVRAPAPLAVGALVTSATALAKQTEDPPPPSPAVAATTAAAADATAVANRRRNRRCNRRRTVDATAEATPLPGAVRTPHQHQACYQFNASSRRPPRTQRPPLLATPAPPAQVTLVLPLPARARAGWRVAARARVPVWAARVAFATTSLPGTGDLQPPTPTAARN